jgi:excisionase family DNA binding protein
MTHDLITAETLAGALNLSVETIWRYTRENKIPFIKLGTRQYRYNLSDVIGALSGSIVREKEPEYKAGGKKYTYQDYLELPEEPGYRYEVLDGELIREPSPNVPHQRSSRRLQRILEDYFWQVDPEGEVFCAPLDVTFHDTTVVQPDIFYVSGEQKAIVEYARVNGPPALVIEILSPSTSSKDRFKKMHIYQCVRVQHYWLVNPDEKSLECFSLNDGVYELVASGTDEEIVKHPGFEGLTVDLKGLW